MKPRTARRARELWLCSPLLIFSSSLSSTGDHLPLPEGAHLSRAPIPTNQDIFGRTRASPVVSLLVFHPNHLQGRQDQDGWTTTTPPATIQVRRESRLAGEAGSSTSGCKCSAYKGGRGAGGDQPGESSRDRGIVPTNQVRAGQGEG